MLEKLAQLLTEKTSGASPSGKEMVPHTGTLHKIELMPNDVNLGGENLLEFVTKGIAYSEDRRAGELCRRRFS